MEAEEAENGKKLGEKMSCLGDPNGQIYIYIYTIYTYSYMCEYTYGLRLMCFFWKFVCVFCFCVFFLFVCFSLITRGNVDLCQNML